MRGEHGDEDATPGSAAEEVLKEVRDAELRLDDGERPRKDKEGATLCAPSRPLQESVQKDREDADREDGEGPSEKNQ